MLETLKRCALRILNFCLIAAVALLVVDVLLGVASRYLWGAQIKWTEELATVTLIWVSFLGIAAAFEAIGSRGRDALAHMRQLLRVLRETGFSDEHRPAAQETMRLTPAASLDDQLRAATAKA